MIIPDVLSADRFYRAAKANYSDEGGQNEEESESHNVH